MAPFAILYGITYPQAHAAVAEHCTVQVMPPATASFVTVALTGACVLTVMPAGGCCRKAILGAAVMVVWAMAGLAGVEAGDAA